MGLGAGVTKMQSHLQGDDAYYCSMLELIPAKFYFHKDDAEKAQSTRFYKVCVTGLLLRTPPSHTAG